jgi:predicted ATPase
MALPPDDPEAMEFGRFRLVPARRQLLVDGGAVELGDRAFDTLLALVDAPGTFLSKEALMRRVWPDRVVEENNLAVQISMLRKALGADRGLIRTVAGRGYQFTGEVRLTRAASAPPAPLSNIPAPLSELIGREAELGAVASLITRHRLVTLVGAGGIGKTRLAVELARRLGPAFPGGVFLAELASLSSPDLIPVTVAASLGLPLVADAVSAAGIGAALGTRRLLLVLDNCEHLIEGAARLAETLLSVAPGLALLATSREPLRATGEHVYRVPSLAMPAEHEDTGDAVRLFVARARAVEPQFTPDASVVSVVSAICRRLDGMPLAIELAAARVPSFGVEGIAARLDDRFAVLTRGNRTALQRQQTLRATLDWSYGLLSERERSGLARLSIFAGGFDGAAAGDVAAAEDMSSDDVIDALGALVSKSLITADLSGVVPEYRLLESTRAYAAEKLVECGEFAAMARRHAEYQLKACERIDLTDATGAPADWLAV